MTSITGTKEVIVEQSRGSTTMQHEEKLRVKFISQRGEVLEWELDASASGLLQHALAVIQDDRIRSVHIGGEGD